MKNLGSATFAILSGMVCVYAFDFTLFQFFVIVLLEYCAMSLNGVLGILRADKSGNTTKREG